MIKAITFKCSEGTTFCVKFDAQFVNVDKNGNPELYLVYNARGRYECLAFIIQEFRIYDRGIDHVTIERDYPYHAEGMQKLCTAEKRIAMEKRMHTRCWFEYAKKVYAHKFAEK